MTTPNPDLEALMEHALMSNGNCMHQGVRLIDELFGEGYAREHPELLAALIQASGNAAALENVATALTRSARALEGIDETLGAYLYQ